jgi:hypothetical protein
MPLKKNKSPKYYLQYTSLSIQMVAIMGLSAWLGMKLDRYCELRFPFFLSLFSVGATVLSIYITIRKLSRHIKE